MSQPAARVSYWISNPLAARLVLVGFAAIAVLFVSITLSPLRSGFADAPDRSPADIMLYQAEVERMWAGEDYYDAAAVELPKRGYPTRSVFNWRVPLPMALIASLGSLAAAQVLLGLLAIVLVCATFGLLVDEGGVYHGLCAALLLGGAFLPCIYSELVVVPELWSGILMALSAILLGRGNERLGVLAGIAALFFRELAGLYCLVCLVLALSGRRYRETTWWIAGLVAYAAFFGWHILQVMPRIAPDALAHAEGWVCFGGAGFLISTVQMYFYLLLLPQWVTAIYLACALLATMSWSTPAGTRIGLAFCAYCVAFCFIGHDFNQYRGAMTAPLVCLVVARFPRAIHQLWLTAFRQEGAPALAARS